jgi:hypothetical protein
MDTQCYFPSAQWILKSSSQEVDMAWTEIGKFTEHSAEYYGIYANFETKLCLLTTRL